MLRHKEPAACSPCDAAVLCKARWDDSSPTCLHGKVTLWERSSDRSRPSPAAKR